MDVYKTVKRIHDGTDQMKIVTQAAAKYGWDNKMALFRTVLDGVVDQCAKEIETRWSERLASVDVYAPSHCHTALVYARWMIDRPATATVTAPAKWVNRERSSGPSEQ